jgi:hypothetical protein
MSDEEFIERFEDCTLPAEDFHHADHIRVVWLYLNRYSVLETLARFCGGLKHFATVNGRSRLYHETISWAHVFLIHERVQRHGAVQSWQQFAEANADLFDWKNSILNSFYRDETLRSDFARRVFVFPDK